MARPPEQTWRPATFVQRGVAVPFTAPGLTGVRVRCSPGKVELLVPRIGGARGVDILPVHEAEEKLSPTVHDALLLERMGRLKQATPRDIRRLAREVAREGAAGHAARDAAERAEAWDREQQTQTRAAILRRILAQAGVAACPEAELEERAGRALETLAGATGRPVSAVPPIVQALSALYAPMGIATTDHDTKCRRSIAAMELVLDQMSTWMNRNGGGSVAANLIPPTLETTIRLARQTLEAAIEKVTDAQGLLRTLVAAPAESAPLLRELTRTEWLLDGWEQICLVWRLGAEARAQRTALMELVLMVPVFPTEVEEWGGLVLDSGQRQARIGSEGQSEDWRTGAATFALVARNEMIRALMA